MTLVPIRDDRVAHTNPHLTVIEGAALVVVAAVDIRAVALVRWNYTRQHANAHVLNQVMVQFESIDVVVDAHGPHDPYDRLVQVSQVEPPIQVDHINQVELFEVDHRHIVEVQAVAGLLKNLAMAKV